MPGDVRYSEGHAKCREGLICMINKKLSKNVAIAISIAVIGIPSGFVVYALGADAKDRNKVQSIEMKQAVVMDKLDTAVDAQDEMKKTQQSIMLNVQKLSDDVEHEAERSRKVDEVILRKLNEIKKAQ